MFQNVSKFKIVRKVRKVVLASDDYESMIRLRFRYDYKIYTIIRLQKTSLQRNAELRSRSFRKYFRLKFFFLNKLLLF